MRLGSIFNLSTRGAKTEFGWKSYALFTGHCSKQIPTEFQIRDQLEIDPKFSYLIEAGCPDLSMRDNYRFGGDDFDDPTTNVQQHRALAIAKPISGGFWPRRSTINLTTKV